MNPMTHSNEPFCGKIKKMRLRSTCMGYGPCPEPDEEVEQLLKIGVSFFGIQKSFTNIIN